MSLKAVTEASEGRVLDLENELAAKDKERGEFMERYERLQSEKLNCLRQNMSLESEVDVLRGDIQRLEAEKNELVGESSHHVDVVKALREGKRSVELKLQSVMRDYDTMSGKYEASKAKVAGFETEKKKRKNSSVGHLEQRLAESESLYESKMAEMQEELALRLEEINENKEVEMRKVKERYIQLFNEKAEQLHSEQEAHKDSKRKVEEADKRIVELEYREVEMQTMMDNTRESIDKKFREKVEEYNVETAKMAEHTEMLEKELERIREQYETVEESYRNSVQMLGSKLREVTTVLKEKDKVKANHSAPATLISLPEENCVIDVPLDPEDCKNLKSPRTSPEKEAARTGTKKKKPRKKRKATRT